MARTPIAVTTAPGPYPAAGTVITPVAADVANLNNYISTGREILVAFNSDAAPHNVTVTSQADEEGRLGTITEAIAAGAYKMYGPLPKAGWADSSGNMNFSADNALVKFFIIQLP